MIRMMSLFTFQKCLIAVLFFYSMTLAALTADSESRELFAQLQAATSEELVSHDERYHRE